MSIDVVNEHFVTTELKCRFYVMMQRKGHSPQMFIFSLQVHLSSVVIDNDNFHFPNVTVTHKNIYRKYETNLIQISSWSSWRWSGHISKIDYWSSFFTLLRCDKVAVNLLAFSVILKINTSPVRTEDNVPSSSLSTPLDPTSLHPVSILRLHLKQQAATAVCNLCTVASSLLMIYCGEINQFSAAAHHTCMNPALYSRTFMLYWTTLAQFMRITEYLSKGGE